ncbi:MAG TPA: glycosyltransferase [Tepidisphaeraceae bacterium]|jgi:processive 1,2-diacylglycerol beta-glucosyltransferase
MNPRILILTASVGAGHNRAAQAIELALREVCPGATVRNVDVLDLTNAAFRWFYGKSYFDVVAAAPHLVGYLYDRLDRPLGRLERGVDKVRFGLQHLNLRSLSALLTGEKWDLAINTHFLPAEVIGTFRTWGRIEFPQVTVTTDFDTHRLWHNPPCEHYFTATEEGRANLAAWGVAPDRITATGIPVHPLFARPRNAWECKRRLDLADDRPVVLQLAGGLGVGPIEAIHRQILDADLPLQIVVVTGRNTAAREQLATIPAPARHHRVILGYTDRMDELMAAADVIVSKPGGLTTSEALCRGAAMLVVDPIPGQETRNADFLLENGAAVKVNNIASLRHKLTALLSEPGRLASLRAAARKLSRPRAAFEVAERSLAILPSLVSEPRFPVPAPAPSRMRRFWRTRPLAQSGSR